MNYSSAPAACCAARVSFEEVMTVSFDTDNRVHAFYFVCIFFSSVTEAKQWLQQSDFKIFLSKILIYERLIKINVNMRAWMVNLHSLYSECPSGYIICNMEKVTHLPLLHCHHLISSRPLQCLEADSFPAFSPVWELSTAGVCVVIWMSFSYCVPSLL